jgi:TIR domain
MLRFSSQIKRRIGAAKMAKYDLAISFAGEQRQLAELIAIRLDSSGYSVFYDFFEQAELWGRDLSIALGSVYSKEARYCLVIVSKEYVNKAWTNLERQNAISRFMKDHENYILCLRTDGTSLPGFPDLIGYVNLDPVGEDGVYSLLLEKLGKPNHDDSISRLSKSDQAIAREIIDACYRRAVFTKMRSEINLDAMYNSLAEALGKVQKLIPKIEEPAFQYTASKIIASLDAIERTKIDVSGHWSYNLSERDVKLIDEEKLEIIRLLLEIRRAAKIPIQLPYILQLDHFFDTKEASQPPRSKDAFG